MALLKFLKGNYANLSKATITEGQILVCGDTGEMFVDVAADKRVKIGDFITVANLAALEALDATSVPTSRLYYVEDGNILARSNGTTWVQVNKQPTIAELKVQLGLGDLAYLSEVSEDNLDSALKEKVNAAAEGNHAHSNKTVLDGITAEKVAAWDAAEGNAKGHADGLNTAMDTRVKAVEAAIGENGSVAGQIKTAIEALDYTDTAVDGEYVSAVNEVDGKISVTRKALPDYSNTYDVKGAANTALENAKAYADGLAANYDEKGAAAGVKTELEAEIAKKVDKVEGKSLISDTEIARLATLANYDDTQVKADIAKKADAEAMTTELGKKVDKVDGKDLIATSEIERLATLKNYDDTALAGKVTAAEGKITALETESAKHATKDELNAVDKKFENYVTSESYGIDKKATEDAIADRYTKEESDGKYALKGADAYDDTELAGRVSALETESAKHAIKTEVEGALALKADKSVVDAMYTNDQIDGFIAEAKKYADDNDADTKYGIVYDSENKKIKLVEGGADVEIDASAFIKDGMINTVIIDDNDGLIITFNTDAGKENIVLPLDQLVDIYTGVEGGRIKVTVNADKSISADLVAGSIGKDYLDEGVKASLALADSAIQAHQDISHLATTEDLNGVDAKFANYTNTTDMNAKFDLKADKTQVATDIATAKSGVEAEAARLDATLKTELQAEIDADVKALADTVYTKTQVYTQAEVDALIAQAQTWGEF